jgi:hypothetical protein
MTAEAGKRGIGDGKRRAAIGYCYGGANVLDLAREGADVAAVVSIHGVLATAKPAPKGGIKAKVLVLHGAADPVSPKAHRDMFEAEMDAAGACWMLLNFGGVVHAYTDPKADFLPVAKYDESATRYTHSMLNAFIDDAFAGGSSGRTSAIRTVTGDVDAISRILPQAPADRSRRRKVANKSAPVKKTPWLRTCARRRIWPCRRDRLSAPRQPRPAALRRIATLGREGRLRRRLLGPVPRHRA